MDADDLSAIQVDLSRIGLSRLLDMLACSDDQLIHDVIVDDARNVFDHRLIKHCFTCQSDGRQLHTNFNIYGFRLL